MMPKDIKVMRTIDYETKSTFEIIMLLKIAHDENIIKHLDIWNYNDYYDVEFYPTDYPVLETALEVLDMLYNTEIKNDYDDGTGLDDITITIEDDIGEYHKLIKKYEKKYGKEKAKIYEDYIKENNYINAINSYCYEANLVANKNNIINKLEIMLSPEFDMYGYLVYYVYLLMNAYKESIKQLKKELKYNTKKAKKEVKKSA